jgi:hypothetical protein
MNTPSNLRPQDYVTLLIPDKALVGMPLKHTGIYSNCLQICTCYIQGALILNSIYPQIEAAFQ